MTIKIRKKAKGGNRILYKSKKLVITANDAKVAEELDLKLKIFLDRTEKELIRQGLLSKNGKKNDVLAIWFEVGKVLNIFLRQNPISPEEKQYLWKDLYERDTLLHKSVHKKEINESRNDYKIAYILAGKYSLDQLKKAGPWALLREIFYSKSIVKDRRIIDWIFKELIKRPRTRNEARPFIQKIAKKFKLLDTSVLNDKELNRKLEIIKKEELEEIKIK